MKGLKKVLTGILAGAMALSLTLSAGSGIKANAEENNTTATSAATITITPTKQGGDSNYNPATSTKPTYKYYEMMYATIDGEKVSYYVDNQELATALDGLKVDNDDLFTVTQVGTTSKWIVAINKKSDNKTEFSGEEVATALATIKDKALVKGDTKDQTDTGIITLAAQGYVLIESSLGSKMLADTFTTKTIYEKNGYPTSDKAQKIANGEATAAEYTHDDVTAEIGKVVSYQVKVEIPESVADKPITVVDTITKGLTLNTAVTVVGDVNNTYTSATFALDSEDTTTGDKVYKLVVPKETVLANKNHTLYFQYTATVNKDAVIYEPEKNKAHIEYDNYATPDVEVKVYTYGFDLEKVDASNPNTKLEGVKFTLQNPTTKEYYAGVDSTGNARFSSTKVELATDKNGKISFNGLASGSYTLTETETKNGYNLLTAPITVIVSATGEISAAGFTVNKITVDNKTVRVLVVENNSGLLLPSTGGIGTTIFYIIGGLLIVAAVVFFVVRRKADAE